MSERSPDLAGVLADAGSVVAGGAALLGTLGFVGGSIARDLGLDVDPIRAAERGAAVGGVFGLAAVIFRALDVH